MGFINSSVKIHESVDNSVNLFVIGYPRNKNKSTPLGVEIIKNILEDSSVIVNIDNTLSLMDKASTNQMLNKLKDHLNEANIPFEYRVTEYEAPNSGILGKLFSISKKTGNRELFTFKLESNFADENLFSIMVTIGCEIYVPLESGDELVQEVFNGYFKDQNMRFSTFKYVIFISDFLGQAALRTKTLKLEDVQKLCAERPE
jgi:hypothetical protein